MKKGLIVAKNELVGKALVATCESLEFKAALVGHKEALEKFLADEPDFVIICDYEEKGSKNDFPGTPTYRDIKNSATNEKIIRCGFRSYDYDDYLRFPFLLTDLEDKLQRKGGDRMAATNCGSLGKGKPFDKKRDAKS